MTTGSAGEAGGGCRGEDTSWLPWFPGQKEGQVDQVRKIL